MEQNSKKILVISNPYIYTKILCKMHKLMTMMNLQLYQQNGKRGKCFIIMRKKHIHTEKVHSDHVVQTIHLADHLMNLHPTYSH